MAVGIMPACLIFRPCVKHVETVDNPPTCPHAYMFDTIDYEMNIVATTQIINSNFDNQRSVLVAQREREIALTR